MTIPDSKRHLSKYANMTADEAVAAFRGEQKKIKALAVAAIVGFAVVAIATDYPIEVLPIALAFLAVVVLGAESFALRRAWNDFLQILTHDRDPEKFLQALTPVIDDSHGVWRRRNRATLEDWYAVGAMNMGFDDVAVAWAQRALEHRDTKTTRAYWASVRASAAFHRGDLAELQRIQGELAALKADGKVGGAVAQAIGTLETGTALFVHTLTGNWVEAERAIGAFDVAANTPLQEVGSEYRKALVAAGQGHMDEAKAHYQYVATYGNTCITRTWAQAWLDGRQ